MGNKDHQIRLYAAQSDIVLEVLHRDGVCYSKKEYVEKKYVESAAIFTTAYSWFVKEAAKISQKPADAEYPYWAFRDLHNLDRSGGGNLLVLDVPLEEVILFDLFDWNKILCMKYIGADEKEEKEFRKMLSQCGTSEMDVMLTNFYPDWKRQIQESWIRLFCYNEQLKAGEETEAKGVQAGLWRIKKEWIVTE